VRIFEYLRVFLVEPHHRPVFAGQQDRKVCREQAGLPRSHSDLRGHAKPEWQLKIERLIVRYGSCSCAPDSRPRGECCQPSCVLTYLLG
jgi:hypothetical protein